MMQNLQEQYDEAMFDFSRGDYGACLTKLRAVLAADPAHFEAQLAVGMALYRQGDFAAAITEGHKAEHLRPKEQLVHTNLSLFYMKSGDKKTAEHHGLQARIASWRDDKSNPGEPPAPGADPELAFVKPPTTPPPKPPEQFPDMPWKKKPNTPP
jgi:predicted Zn-dependent protease